MSQQGKNEYILNEYLSLRVKQDLESLYCDFYKNFGWTIENITPDTFDNRYMTIKLKRDRRIKNKIELNELQRKGENALKAIERLEHSKTSLATAVALGIGVIGTAFIAGAVFSFLAKLYLLHIILAIIGFIGWVLPYFAYIRIRHKKTEEANNLIEKQYDILYEVCEKANRLLE